MNKSEALKELKEALKEELELLKLSHENPKRNMWVYRVDDILREGFGPNSDEFKLFMEGVPRDELKGSDRQLQKWLDSRLKRRATIIRSIIEKYERQKAIVKPGSLEFYEELQGWFKELVAFQKQLYGGRVPNAELEPLREKLIRRAPRFKQQVIDLTGKQYGEQFGRTFDVWDEALSRYIYDGSNWSNRYSLNALVDCVNEALGVLESGEVPQHTTEAEIPQDSTQMANFLFDKMQFHPRVVKASESRFKSGHYSDAIFAAFKAVNNFVKQRTGLALDGKGLMTEVFGKNNPVIKLNEGRTDSDKDEQEGFMHLFTGGMLGIRNPKAHEEVAELDAHKTLEYLGFASLLMRRAEEGKLKRTRKKQSKSPKS